MVLASMGTSAEQPGLKMTRPVADMECPAWNMGVEMMQALTSKEYAGKVRPRLAGMRLLIHASRIMPRFSNGRYCRS